jgi:hypothetical protein
MVQSSVRTKPTFPPTITSVVQIDAPHKRSKGSWCFVVSSTRTILTAHATLQHTTVNAGNSLLIIVHVKYRFDPAILERTEILKYIGREYNNHLCHANVAVFPFLR